MLFVEGGLSTFLTTFSLPLFYDFVSFFFMNSKDDSFTHTKSNTRCVANANEGNVTVITRSISILADMLAGRLTPFHHVCCIPNKTVVPSTHLFVFVCVQLCQ